MREINTNAAKSLDQISTDELESKIHKLQNIDLAVASTGEVSRMMGSILDQCPLQVRPLVLSGVYRARKRSSSDPFTNTRELWYPPSSVINKLGRLNDVGESRFYATNTVNTAMLELRPVAGDIITLLKIHTKNKPYDSLKKVIFIGIERSRSDTTQNLTEEDIFRNSRSFRKSLGENNYNKWLIVDNYLSKILGKEVLTSEEYMYKPTVALSSLLFKIPNLDAINYPSVETDSYGINICMVPEKADKYFKPSEAWMAEIGQHDKINGVMLPRCKFFRRSRYIHDDGFIDWLNVGEGVNSQEINRFLGNTKIEILPTFPTP